MVSKGTGYVVAAVVIGGVAIAAIFLLGGNMPTSTSQAPGISTNPSSTFTPSTTGSASGSGFNVSNVFTYSPYTYTSSVYNNQVTTSNTVNVNTKVGLINR